MLLTDFEWALEFVTIVNLSTFLLSNHFSIHLLEVSIVAKLLIAIYNLPEKPEKPPWAMGELKMLTSVALSCLQNELNFSVCLAFVVFH